MEERAKVVPVSFEIENDAFLPRAQVSEQAAYAVFASDARYSPPGEVAFGRFNL
jgi:hypothetical protein